MTAYSFPEMISLILNLFFGGGFLISFLTLRAQRKKATSEAKGAEATAKGSELDNVEEAIKIWREMAVEMKTQRDEALKSFGEMAKQVEGLRRDIKKLNTINADILKLLDKISHDNLELTVEKIKQEIKKSDA